MAAGPNKGKQEKTTAAPSKARRVLGFFTPDLGTGPTQVRETHGMFLQILASLFASVNILGRDHPYLQPGAKFSLGELFATTLAKIDWKNKQQMPQTIFFCAVWGLLASTVLYVVTAVLLFVATPSHAYAQDTADKGTTADGGMFSVPDNDLAQQFLHNLVEGKPITALEGQNTEGESQTVDGGVLQSAFRDMLKYYSSVILIIASFMVLYHIIMLIVNSAWSGKPLEGANQIWGPLRLAIAIGLLVPLSGGLNSGQYMVLKIAEVGSAAGTKAWNTFTSALADHSGRLNLGQDDEVRNEFVKMILVHACMKDINMHAGGDSTTNSVYERHLVSRFLNTGIAVSNTQASIVYPPNVLKYSDFLGFVYCGKITFPDTSLKSDTGLVLAGNNSATTMNKLSQDIRKITDAAATNLNTKAKDLGDKLVDLQAGYEGDDRASAAMLADPKGAPLVGEIKAAINGYYSEVNTNIQNAIINNQSWQFLQNSSWILAGAYYAQISAYQNVVFTAAKTPPKVELGPVFGKKENPGGILAAIKNIGSMFTKSAGAYASPEEEHFVENVNVTYAPFVKQAVFETQATASNASDSSSTAVENTNPGPMGGAFTMDKDTFINMFKNGAADPFAAFINAGHYVLNSGLTAFAVGLAILVGAEVQGAIPLVGGGAVSTVSLAGWVMTFSIYLISLGALLCLILPLVPVIKFLGGVVTWMLAVLEAVIGMPLFALAHLTPGGNGLLDPARKGYIMLFHIAIRPMLMVFGMVVAIIIITPAILLLNAMFLPAINSAWQPDDGGLVMAFVMLGLWAFFSYGILKKVFSFQDYISHATMEWLGGGGYRFERYQGEGNAFAAYGAFQTVTGAANKFIDDRKKAALGSLEKGPKGGGDDDDDDPKYLTGGLANAGNNPIASGGPGFGGGGGGGGAGTTIGIGASTAGKKGSSSQRGGLSSAPLSPSGRPQSFGFGSGAVAAGSAPAGSTITSNINPSGKPQPTKAQTGRKGVAPVIAGLGLAASAVAGGVGGGKAEAATPGAVRGAPTEQLRLNDMGIGKSAGQTFSSTVGAVGSPGRTAKDMQANLTNPTQQGLPRNSASAGNLDSAGLNEREAAANRANAAAGGANKEASTAGFRSSAASSGMASATRSPTGRTVLAALGASALATGGAGAADAKANLPGQKVDMQTAKAFPGVIAGLQQSKSNSSTRAGLSGTGAVSGSAAQQVAGINFNNTQSGNSATGAAQARPPTSGLSGTRTSVAGGLGVGGGVGVGGGYTQGTTSVGFGGGSSSSADPEAAGGFGGLTGGAPITGGAPAGGSSGVNYMGSASGNERSESSSLLTDTPGTGLGAAQNSGTGSVSVGGFTADSGDGGGYNLTAAETPSGFGSTPTEGNSGGFAPISDSGASAALVDGAGGNDAGYNNANSAMEQSSPAQQVTAPDAGIGDAGQVSASQQAFEPAGNNGGQSMLGTVEPTLTSQSAAPMPAPQTSGFVNVPAAPAGGSMNYSAPSQGSVLTQGGTYAPASQAAAPAVTITQGVSAPVQTASADRPTTDSGKAVGEAADAARAGNSPKIYDMNLTKSANSLTDFYAQQRALEEAKENKLKKKPQPPQKPPGSDGKL